MVSLKARSFARKMHWNLLSVFVNVFFALRYRVKQNHRWFAGWTGVELSCPHWASRRPPEATAANSPRKAPEAERRSTWRCSSATSRLQTSCCQKALRWTPGETMARGLRGRARNPVSNLGHLNKVSELKFWETSLHFQQVFVKVVAIRPNKLSIYCIWNMHWNLFSVFVNAFCSEQFEVVESKTFIVRLLNEYRAQLSTTFVVSTSWTSAKPQRPTAPGKRLRLDAAPSCGGQRQGRGCRVPAVERRCGGRHGQQWPGAPEIEIHEKKVCIFSKCVEKVVTFKPKDHNATWYGSGHVWINDRSCRTFYWRQWCKQHALKLVQCVCECFLLWTVWSCWIQNIHRSFVERVQSSAVHNFRRLHVVDLCEATAADGPGKAPEVGRRSTWLRARARWRLRSSWSQKAPRWMPRTTVARGPRGRARNPVSNLGHLRKFFGIEIRERQVLHLQQMLGKSSPQKVCNRFSGNVLARSWVRHYSVVAQGVYPNLVGPRSTERLEVIFVSSFDIQEASPVVGKLSEMLLLNSSCNFNIFQTYAKLA